MECLQCPTDEMEERVGSLYCPSCQWMTTREGYAALVNPATWDMAAFRRACDQWEKNRKQNLKPPPIRSIEAPENGKGPPLSGMRLICQVCEDTSGCELREFWLLASLINDQKAFSQTQRAINDLSKQGFWLDGRQAIIYGKLQESQLHGKFGDVVFIGERLKKDKLASFFVRHWKYEPESGAAFWLESLLKRLEKCQKSSEGGMYERA